MFEEHKIALDNAVRPALILSNFDWSAYLGAAAAARPNGLSVE